MTNVGETGFYGLPVWNSGKTVFLEIKKKQLDTIQSPFQGNLDLGISRHGLRALGYPSF
jgi:hypothetical protein